MSNVFRGCGNLGAIPVLRHVSVKGEPRPVVDLRVYFDRSVPKDDGYEDDGGFWLSVSLWGPRAETASRVLDKGARVSVVGRLRLEMWEDNEGKPRSELRLTASEVNVDPLCIDTIVFRTSQHSSTEEPMDDELPH